VVRGFKLRLPGRCYLSNAAKVSEVSAVLRRSLLIIVVVLITGGVAPANPAPAGADPATFINNFSKQLRVVSSCTPRSRNWRDFENCSAVKQLRSQFLLAFQGEAL